MAGAISTTDVKKAAAELAAMRGSLVRWLKYRQLNDSVMAGTVVTLKKPLPYAQRVLAGSRDMAIEQDLATKLVALLQVVMPSASLPNANIQQNPQAAVQLAQIAISGQAPGQPPPSMSGVGSTHPWLWPVLIVGGLVMLVTTSIKTSADIAAQKEQDACIEAGACTDYGFWLKAGSIAGLFWFAWVELGLGDAVKSQLKRRS